MHIAALTAIPKLCHHPSPDKPSRYNIKGTPFWLFPQDNFRISHLMIDQNAGCRLSRWHPLSTQTLTNPTWITTSQLQTETYKVDYHSNRTSENQPSSPHTAHQKDHIAGL